MGPTIKFDWHFRWVTIKVDNRAKLHLAFQQFRFGLKSTKLFTGPKVVARIYPIGR